jgi:uncharacterized repeat protein (TIGR01451 family)
VVKSFSVATAALGATVVLKIRLTNPNAVAITGATFNDAYPSGLVNTATPAGAIAGVGCSGSVTAAVNGTALALAAGTVPASSSCDITANVTSNTNGVYTNSSGVVATTNGGSSAASNASITMGTVMVAPTVSKSFSPATVGVGVDSVLKLTVVNPNPVAMTGVAWSDTYPANLVNSATPAGTLTGVGCSGTVAAVAGGNTLALTAATVPASGSCDITANVKSALAGTYTNTTGTLTSGNAPTSATAQASLQVLALPVVGKSFATSPLAKDATTQLYITVTNSNAVAITGVAFTDNYPTTTPDAPDNKLVNADAITSASPGTCTGTLTAVSGARAFSLVGGTVPAGTTCTYTANVKSATTVSPASYVNSSGPVTTTNAGTGASASATLVVVNGPTVAKGFAPASITVGSTSVLTLTLGTTAGGAGSTAATLTDTYPAGLVNASGTPLLSNGCLGTVTAVAGANTLAISGGTIPPNSSCSITVTVTAAATGSYTNSIAAGALSTSSGTNPLGGSATLTVVPAGVQVAGAVYSDANHNLQKDSLEAGTGLVLFAKLLSAGAPAGPALQAVAVDPTTGAYVFTGVPAGRYSVAINGNSSLADVTPAVPSSWTGTQNASGLAGNVVVTTVDAQGPSFGLFNGNLLTGRVFADNGSGGGTAHNGVVDGSEAGLGGATVRLTNGAATTWDSTTSAADGSWRLWVPLAQAGTTLRVVQDAVAGWRLVSGYPSASFDRSAGSLAVSYTAGTNTTALTLGNVAQEVLATPQQAQLAPGASRLYAHSYTPGTAGQLTFVVSGSASDGSAWPLVLYRDTNCNGAIDAADTPVLGAVTTGAGTPVCVLARLAAPPGAAPGVLHRLSLQASLAYTGTSPLLSTVLSLDDLTTVLDAAGSAATGSLLLVKAQDTATPLPGGRITYTLTYTNTGSAPLTGLRISDATPGFTRFASAACVAPLAAGLLACTVSTSPAVGATGAVEWLLTGSLLPSASGQVTFSVDIGSAP